MRKKLLSACIVAALGAGYATVALSQVKPDTLVKQRQAAMTLQGKYFGPLVGMLKGTVPYDANVVARNAGYLDVLDNMPWDGFAESTKGVKSAALPAIWTEPGEVQAGRRPAPDRGDRARRRLQERQRRRREGSHRRRRQVVR